MKRTLNTETAKIALSILAAKNPGLYKTGNPEKQLAIWAAAIAPDLPPHQVHEVVIQVCAETRLPEIADINAKWAEIKRDRVRDAFEPDPPREIADNPIAFLEYKKTWVRSIALGNNPGTAQRIALDNAKRFIGISSGNNTRLITEGGAE